MATRTQQPPRKITLTPVEPLQATPSRDTLGQQPLVATSLHAQYQRRFIHEGWEPKGFERFPYRRAVLHQMNVLGGINDSKLPARERYTPVSPCVESLECQCEGPYGEQ